MVYIGRGRKGWNGPVDEAHILCHNVRSLYINDLCFPFISNDMDKKPQIIAFEYLSRDEHRLSKSCLKCARRSFQMSHGYLSILVGIISYT